LCFLISKICFFITKNCFIKTRERFFETFADLFGENYGRFKRKFCGNQITELTTPNIYLDMTVFAVIIEDGI